MSLQLKYRSVELTYIIRHTYADITQRYKQPIPIPEFVVFCYPVVDGNVLFTKWLPMMYIQHTLQPISSPFVCLSCILYYQPLLQISLCCKQSYTSLRISHLILLRLRLSIVRWLSFILSIISLSPTVAGLLTCSDPLCRRLIKLMSIPCYVYVTCYVNDVLSFIKNAMATLLFRPSLILQWDIEPSNQIERT